MYGKRYLRTTKSGFRVYSVDGEAIRNDGKHVGFIGGANHYSDPDMVKRPNEVWVEKFLPAKGKQAIARHEEVEAREMRYGHLPYARAHAKANKAEAAYRKRQGTGVPGNRKRK